ncbi:RNA methyltransferase [Clostridium botulinum]|nr:RNA methyltransferase [Clostridium botulinum]
MISSKDNHLIKEVRKLREKKHRAQNKSFIIEGFRFFEEALKSNSSIVKVFIEEKNLNKLEELYKKYSLDNKIDTYVVNSSVLKSISNTQNPQGVVAVISYLKKERLDLQNGFYILADKVQDPGNMGTIIRTAHAAGALGIITTKGTVDIYNEKTLRSTMGSIFYISIIEDENLEIVKLLQKNGFKLLVSSLDTNNNFYDIDMTENIIISVGNEGNGISEDLDNLSDMKVKIPMPGAAESLNVAVACSIMTFERIRQINK